MVQSEFICLFTNISRLVIDHNDLEGPIFRQAVQVFYNLGQFLAKRRHRGEKISSLFQRVFLGREKTHLGWPVSEVYVSAGPLHAREDTPLMGVILMITDNST